MNEKEICEEQREKLKDEADSLRRLAFCGVCLSTVATLLVVIAVPTGGGNKHVCLIKSLAHKLSVSKFPTNGH